MPTTIVGILTFMRINLQFSLIKHEKSCKISGPDQTILNLSVFPVHLTKFWFNPTYGLGDLV